MSEASESGGYDWNKALDLDRSTLTKNMVDRMETCLRSVQVARDDLAEIVAECKEREFGPNDIRAMKKIAKLRLDEKLGDAQEQLAALERISAVVGFDLFAWAAKR